MEYSLIKYTPDTRIHKIDNNDKLFWVTALLTRMFDMAGQKSDEVTLKLLVRELMRDLETRYKLLSVEEVETIISNGIRGDYGDYYGLNLTSISKWFKAYLESGAHNEYLASKVKELKLMLPQKTGLTDEEVDEIFKNGCIRCFNEYVQSGKFNDYGSENYHFLKRKGIIKLNETQIEQYLKDATAEYKEEMKRQSLSNNKNDARDAAKILKNFMQVDDRNANVQSIAQYNAMSDFFASLVQRKIQIENILK